VFVASCRTAVFAIVMFADPDRILAAHARGLGMALLLVTLASRAASVSGGTGGCLALGGFQLGGTSARRARGLE
jgi:hypothetical protein